MVRNTAAIQVARHQLEGTNPVVLAETVVRKIAEVSDSEPNRYTYSLTVPELLEGADILITVDDHIGWITLGQNLGDQSVPDQDLIKEHYKKLQEMTDGLAKIIKMKVMLVLRTKHKIFSVTSA